MRIEISFLPYQFGVGVYVGPHACISIMLTWVLIRIWIGSGEEEPSK